MSRGLPLRWCEVAVIGIVCPVHDVAFANDIANRWLIHMTRLHVPKAISDWRRCKDVSHAEYQVSLTRRSGAEAIAEDLSGSCKYVVPLAARREVARYPRCRHSDHANSSAYGFSVGRRRDKPTPSPSGVNDTDPARPAVSATS